MKCRLLCISILFYINFHLPSLGFLLPKFCLFPNASGYVIISMHICSKRVKGECEKIFG